MSVTGLPPPSHLHMFFDLAFPHPSFSQTPHVCHTTHAHLSNTLRASVAFFPDMCLCHSSTTHPVVFPLCPLCSQQYKAGTLLCHSCERGSPLCSPEQRPEQYPRVVFCSLPNRGLFCGLSTFLSVGNQTTVLVVGGQSRSEPLIQCGFVT